MGVETSECVEPCTDFEVGFDELSSGWILGGIGCEPGTGEREEAFEAIGEEVWSFGNGPPI